MKLRITNETINTLVTPAKFAMTDVLSIIPKLTVGQFEGCAINIVCNDNKTLVITNGIALLYYKIEDFYAGLEPISLVEDNSIYYSQELCEIDFKIIMAAEQADEDAGTFRVIRNKMFGARDPELEVEDTITQCSES